LLISTQDDLAPIVGEDSGQHAGGYRLVIDKIFLNHVLKELFTREALLELATGCLAVVFFRTLPNQKAELVRVVNEGINLQTLAIGNGTNYILMIQTTNISVEVLGKECMQAVNSCRYAISKSRFLRKLLFVHGHWSDSSNSRIIHHISYKGIICISGCLQLQGWV